MILGNDGFIKNGDLWTKIEEEGDQMKMTHIEDINQIIKDNGYLQQDAQNGFTKDRKYRRIGRVPVLSLIEHSKVEPGIAAGDMETQAKEMKKFLKNHPEYCTVHKGL